MGRWNQRVEERKCREKLPNIYLCSFICCYELWIIVKMLIGEILLEVKQTFKINGIIIFINKQRCIQCTAKLSTASDIPKDDYESFNFLRNLSREHKDNKVN